MRKKLIIVTAIWLGWAALVIPITRDTFNEFEIISKTGTSKYGRCERTRFNNILKLTIHYEDEQESTAETIFLPYSLKCDDKLLSKLFDHDVTITSYRSHTLGVSAGDEIIMHVKDSLWKVESKGHIVGFTAFLAFAFSIIALIKGPHKRYKHQWLENLRDRWNE